MRTPLPAVVAAAACLLVSGCAQEPARPPATSAVVTEAPGVGGAEPITTPEVLPTPDGVGGSGAPGASIPVPGSTTSSGGGGEDADTQVDPAGYTTEDGRLSHLDFDSPDRNLHCGIWDTGDDDAFYGCTLERRSYTEPPDRGCRQQFGKGFVASFAGRPHAACRGDVLFDGETRTVPVLPSGSAIGYGAIECSMSGNTVTCGNQRGDGFTLSASAYALRG